MRGPDVKNNPLVTVVIATYNRPDTLCVAVRSVLRQTMPDWRLLVIGDRCDARTEDALASVSDGRVSYINLPVRFGEQGGPNSVGMALADTEFIALLNHDDVWFPDHLETALGTLRTSGADIFVGRAASATESVDDGAGGVRPRFSDAGPIGFPEHQLFHRNPTLVEPASNYVFSSALSRRVGPWATQRRLYRIPLQDWLLCAWRSGGRFSWGREITVLNILTHYHRVSGKGCYAEASSEHRFVEDLMERLPPGEIRTMILDDVRRGNGIRKPWRLYHSSNPLVKLLVRVAANGVTAGIYRRTGLDLYSALIPLAGERPGRGMNRLSRIRTGMPPPVIPDYDSLLADTIAALRDARGTGGKN